MNVIQEWVTELSFMQQSVLLSAVRGPDGIRKHHPVKDLIRFFRRSILISAFDRKALNNPFIPGGGSFTGPVTPEAGWDKVLKQHRELFGEQSAIYDGLPWEEMMTEATDNFLTARDELPFHYFTHFMHGAEVIGYKHPDERVRKFWNGVYVRMVHALHIWPETEEQMDARLGDNMEKWQARSDEAAVCSD